GGRRGGGRRLARRAARQRRQGVHRAGVRPRGVRRARRRDPEVRARPAVRVRVSAQDRVRRRAAEDAHGQDPPHRAAPAGDGIRAVTTAPVQEKGPVALVPVATARLVGFVALASLGALEWQRMVAGLSSVRALLWVAAATAAGAAVFACDRLPRRRRGVGLVLVVLLSILAALVVS